jgi:hypothetical protein
VAERILEQEKAMAELVAGTFDRELETALGEPGRSPLTPVTPLGKPSGRPSQARGHGAVAGGRHRDGVEAGWRAGAAARESHGGRGAAHRGAPAPRVRRGRAHPVLRAGARSRR